MFERMRGVATRVVAIVTGWIHADSAVQGSFAWVLHLGSMDMNWSSAASRFRMHQPQACLVHPCRVLIGAAAVTIEPGAPLAAAARLMRRGGVKRLPVMDHGRLVGIVTRADVLKSYLRDDAEILTDVVEGVIRGSMGIDPTTLEVEVDDGMVRMRGQVERRSEVEIIATLTRGVAGVMDVESALTFRFDDRGAQPPKEQRHI